MASHGSRAAITEFILSNVLAIALMATDLLPIPPMALLSLASSVNFPLYRYMFFLTSIIFMGMTAVISNPYVKNVIGRL